MSAGPYNPKAAKPKWLRKDAQTEFLQFAHGRVERTPFPMGGFVYFARATPDDGKHLYSGNDFYAARVAITKAEG